MMEFTFEASAWEMSLNALRPGTQLSAGRFLAMMETETEEQLEAALELLDSKNILLDISDLPLLTSSGDTGTRLRLEKQLVSQNKLLTGLEENDPLRLYLEEIAQSDEDEMGMKLPHVVELASRYAGHSVLLLDLIQEGSLGLWQGMVNEAADLDRCILRSIHKAITLQARSNGVGQKMRQALEDYRAVDERLLGELGRNATLEEIAEALHMTLQETEAVSQMLDAARTVSRAKAAQEEPEETPEDQMAVEDTAYFQSRARIAELLSGLGQKEQQLLTLRFGLEGGLPLSPEETGRKLGMTAEEVVALEGVALAQLRK
jgi:RNA polymerase primary sigma factor